MNRIALPHGPRALAHQAGVTLIELMIGMLIGMLAILVISQVMLVSEGQKRTTTGGADAQVNGALSLYAIQRDIQIAGYGFSSNPEILGCQIRAQFAGALLPGVSGRLSPLVITPESPRVAGGAGDAIRVFASSKTSYAVPARVIKPGLNANGQSVPVSSALGFSQGDLMLVARDDVLPCWLFQVTAVPTAKDVPRADNPASWNAAGQPTQLYDDGSFLVNFGSLIDNEYRVSGTKVLQVSSFDANSPALRSTRDIQSDVVTMRAYYGRDTSADGVVDVFDTTTPTTSAGWQNVLSVRVIVVARSGQYEKEQVTKANPKVDVGTTPPTTAIGGDVAACGASECLTIDVGVNPLADVEANHYRYKTFETVVPLRNLLWKSS